MATEEIDFAGVEALSTTVREALKWQGRGAVPIAIKAGRKLPEFSGWEKSRRRSAADLSNELSGDRNLALLLGEPSGGLVDVDLDCPEAVAAAPYLIPKTGMKHRRRGEAITHWWYRCIDGSPRPMRLEDLPPGGGKRGKMLVELRSTGGQTVIPPSRYEDIPDLNQIGGLLEWESQANAAELTTFDLGRCVRELAAATLLARHGFGPGGRHQAYLALAGGLANLGWSQEHALRFCLAISATYTDHDDTQEIEYDRVGSTYVAHDTGEEHTGWPTLEEIIGEDVVKRALSWLEREEDLLDQDSAFEWMTLGQLLEKRNVETDWLVPGLLYMGSICNLQGESGAGKTILALHWILELIRKGYPVMWVDEEMGAPQLGDRAWTLLRDSEREDPTKLGELLSYSGMSGVTSAHTDWLLERISQTEAAHGRGIVVLDSMRNLLGNEGLNENHNDEVSGWLQRVAVPLRREGWSVIILDHLTKDSDGRGQYAVGAGAKLSVADYSWRVLTVNDAPFSKTRIGRLKIRVMKDREGAIPMRELSYKIGGDGTGRTICVPEGPVSVPKAAAQTGRSDIERQIIIYLSESHRGPEMGCPQDTVAAHVTGRRGTVYDTIAALADDETSGIHREKSGGNRYLVWWEPPEGEGTAEEVDFS